METTNIQPAPVIEPSGSHQFPWHGEKVAFQNMFGELLKLYNGKFVAIHQGQVAAVGENMVDATIKAVKLFGNVPMYIHLVSESPRSKIKLRSPHIVLER